MADGASIAIVPAGALAEGTPGDGGPIVIDARHRHEFARGHIPGATWLGWEEWCAPPPPGAGPTLAEPGYWGGLDRPEQLAGRLADAGIRDDRPLLVYADGPHSKGREGRIAWMLLYLGAADVRLLDGGWSAWVAAGGPVSTEARAPVVGRFAPAVRVHRRATLPELRHRYLAGTPPLFVDTRSGDEYEGRLHPYLPRMGHLPGTVLFPFADLFQPDGIYAAPSTYLERLPERARRDVELATYCEVGVRASLTALLHEIATGRIVAVFDGSLMDWGLDLDLPVLRGAEPGA